MLQLSKNGEGWQVYFFNVFYSLWSFKVEGFILGEIYIFRIMVINDRGNSLYSVVFIVVFICFVCEFELLLLQYFLI